jgi:hypothetical protein
VGRITTRARREESKARLILVRFACQQFVRGWCVVFATPSPYVLGRFGCFLWPGLET